MGKIEKDPMLELFMEESIQLITELSGIVEENREQNGYDYESVKEIFRIFHTLKADATMMLFENIAEPARSFEKVLYYYRDQKKEIKDAVSFNGVLDEIIAFIQQELCKIEEMGITDGDSQPLLEKIQNFYEGLEAKNPDAEVKKEKQVYYIAGKFTDADATAGMKFTDTADNMLGNYVVEKKQSAGKTEAFQEPLDTEPLHARQATKYNRKKHTLITDEDILRLKNISSDLEKVLDSYANRFKNVSIIALEEENLDELRAFNSRIKRWVKEIQAADFKGIALKMQTVIREMETTLLKPIALRITGEDTIIEKSSLEKISSAMIHLLRNCADHGIETAEKRKAAGKEETGQIHIDIAEENRRVKIVIGDDGAGLCKEQILAKAKERGMLQKPEEEYSEQEIYQLLLLHGFTTKKEVTNYSGLGVGLDVVNQNIRELGGEFFISSRLGQGTEFTILL